MAWFSADLHIHSCLSPCGDLSASPRLIAEFARDAGLDLIALTDHNSTLNCPALAAHCQRLGLGACFGAEVTTAEELHTLCLFGDLATAMNFGDFAYEHLLPVANEPETFGDQVYVDENDDILGEVDKLLINALDLGIDALEPEVHRRGGLYIPAHVDRSAFSCMSQLGYVPPGNYDALELYRNATTLASLRFSPAPSPGLQNLDSAQFAALSNRLAKGDLIPAMAWHDAFLQRHTLPVPLCASSDAHYPQDIGQRRTLFWADAPTFAGLKAALHHGWTVACWGPGLPRPAAD